MLTAKEKIEDFKEVTEAEKLALETAESAWERPPQFFIDRWNELAGKDGKYNETTGFFELNGITDIGFKEALTIYQVSAYTKLTVDTRLNQRFERGSGYRTIFSIKSPDGTYINAKRICYRNDSIEVFKAEGMNVSGWDEVYSAFRWCKNLRSVGTLWYINDNQSFFQSPNLEYVEIRSVRNNIDFHDNPKLNLDTFKFMIRYAMGSPQITIKVHSDTYAKLTGDETNDAYNNLTDEEKTQWTALVEQAANKQIQFTTA